MSPHPERREALVEGRTDVLQRVAQCDQRTRLALGMLRACPGNNVFDIEIFAFSLAKVAKADLQLGPKRSQGVDMLLKQFAPDFFLSCLGELRMGGAFRTGTKNSAILALKVSMPGDKSIADVISPDIFYFDNVGDYECAAKSQFVKIFLLRRKWSSF